jgi:hypothetical protein
MRIGCLASNQTLGASVETLANEALKTKFFHILLKLCRCLRSISVPIDLL